MSGRYLLETSVAIRILNQEVAVEARRGSGLEMFLSLGSSASFCSEPRCQAGPR